MARCSNACICIANFLTILVAIPLISFGYWLKHESTGQCQKNFPMYIMIAGAVFLAISLFGILGSCCRLNFFMWLFLFFMFLLIVCAMISTTFSFIVTNKAALNALSEFKLGNSTGWVERWVTRDWDRTEKCLADTKFCTVKFSAVINEAASVLQLPNATVLQLPNATSSSDHLSPIEIGCCKPPNECGFTLVNGNWEAPKSGIKSENSDCKTWSSDIDKLCYGCNTCKAGMIATTNKAMKLNAYASAAILLYLLIVYSIGCCAFRSNRADKYYYRR